MSRIEIEIPDKLLFSTDIPIRKSDINGGRHLAFHMVLSFTEEARTRFWKFLGFSEGNVNDIGVITTDAGIIYKKQGFYGQTLKVEVGIADFHTKGCDIIYRMSNMENGEELFRAKSRILFFNYREQKVVPVPEDFKTKVASLQSLPSELNTSVLQENS